MQPTTRTWLMGFSGGFFLMVAIQALGEVVAGGAPVAVWIQLIAGTVVVVSSVGVLLQTSKGRAGSGSGGGSGSSS